MLAADLIIARIKPRPGRDQGNARPDLVGDNGPAEARSPAIENPHPVTIGNTACRGIIRVEADPLMALDLGLTADNAVIQL